MNTTAERIEEIATYLDGLTNDELLEEYVNILKSITQHGLGGDKELQEARRIAKALIIEKMNN